MLQGDYFLGGRSSKTIPCRSCNASASSYPVKRPHNAIFLSIDLKKSPSSKVRRPKGSNSLRSNHSLTRIAFVSWILGLFTKNVFRFHQGLHVKAHAFYGKRKRSSLTLTCTKWSVAKRFFLLAQLPRYVI